MNSGEESGLLSASDQDFLSTELLRELAERSRVGIVTYPILFAAVGFASGLHLDHGVFVAVTGALLCLASGARVYFSGKILKTKAPVSRGVRVGLKAAILSVAVIWGSVGACVVALYGLSIRGLLVVFATGGLGAGSIVSLAADAKIMRMYMTSLILPMVCVLALTAHVDSLAYAVMTLVYLAYLNVQATAVHAKTRSVLEKNRVILKQKTEIERARDQALTATRLKSEFLSNMSHEIRTPLNGILGLCDLLKERVRTDSENTRMLSLVHRSGQTLLALTNDILDLSKIESGRLELHKVPFEVRRDMEDAVAVFEPLAKQKNISLDVTFGENIPPAVEGDSMRIRQVLSNLLSNAIKFTSRGGVQLRISWLEGEGGRGRLQFEVQDSGIGIPPSRREKIFRPFSQADASMASSFGGTGLGLSISKGLCEAMEGNISFESREGHGTVFRFTVRCQTAELAAAADKAILSPDSGLLSMGGEVLVVEDNEINREVVTAVLKRLGIAHALASSGQEALKMMTDSPGRFPMMLVDYYMPGMSGIELAREVRKQFAGERIRIVGMSASVSEDVKQACLSVGITEHISKPLNLEAVRAMFFRAGAVAAEESPRKLPAAGTVIDYDALMRNFSGLEEVLHGVVRKIVNDLPAYLEEIDKAERSGNLEALHKAVHVLNGVIGTLRPPVLLAVGRRWEDAIQQKNYALMPELQSEFRRQMKLFRTELTEGTLKAGLRRSA